MRMSSMTIHERILGFMTGLTLLALCVLPKGQAGAQDLFAGSIKAVETQNPAEVVKIIRAGYTGVLSGKPGDAVFAGDTLKTGAGVKAQIELSDGTVVVLGPNSGTQIKGYQVDRYQAKRNTVMKTLKGTVRFIVAKLFKPHPAGAEMSWKDSSVTIEAMNCVAGVRGTDFIFSVGQDEIELAVLDGAVSMRGANPSLRGEVIVGTSQFSVVKRGGVPSQPEALSVEKLGALTDATTLKNPRTSMNGNGTKTGSKRTYDEKDLTRELATGVPLGESLDRAVQSGMPIGDAVSTAIVSAGVDPGVVVYTAVVEGYPVNQVVESCVKCGAPLNTVVSSALAGGGEKKLIIIGAQDAGTPPGAIANAFAAAGSPTAPIAGGAGLSGGASPVVIPAPPTAIGGGGGAPASTKKASPYRP